MFNFKASASSEIGRSLTGADQYDPHTDISTQTFRDPRFLNALRAEAQARGQSFDNDEDLIRWFTRGRAWADMNTVSSASDMLRAYQADPERRERQKYLQDTWNRLPMFWQEGGRGAEGLMDNVLAAVLDPINIFGAIGVPARAARAAQLAKQAGGSPMRAAITAGAKRGAIGEAKVAGAAEGLINTSTQLRDQQLGLQDEFSFGQLGLATGAGAAIGGGAGALIGGGVGAATARPAVRTMDNLTGLNYPTEAIPDMPWAEQQRIAQTQRPFTPEPDPAATGEEAPPPPTPEEERQARYDAQAKAIEEELNVLREDITRSRSSGVSEDILSEDMQRAQELARLRSFPQRFMREDEQIRQLEGSSSVEDQATARARRAAFEEDLQAFNLALEGRTPAERAAALDRLEGQMSFDSDGGQPAMRQTEAAGAEAPPARAPEGEATATEAPLAPEPAPYQPTTPLTRRAAEEAQSLGLTGRVIDALVEDGSLPLSATGKVSAPALRKIAENTEAIEAAMRRIQGGDAAPEQAASPAPDAPFRPTGEWQPMPEGAVMPGGMEFRTDMTTGETLVRDPSLVGQTGEAPPTRPGDDIEPPAGPAPEETPAAAPPNLARMRGRLLAAGVDPRAVGPGSGKGGNLTKKDIRDLSQAGESDYALHAREDLARRFDYAEKLGVPASNPRALRNLLRILGQDPEYKARVDEEDLLTLFDEQQRRAGIGERESEMAGRMTSTERSRWKKMVRSLRRANPEMSNEDIEGMARAEIRAQRNDPTGESPRSTAGAIERAAQFSTAGRNARGGIQGDLRPGMAIERDADGNVVRTVTRDGLQAHEQVYQGKMTFDRDGAQVAAARNVRLNAERAKAAQKADDSYNAFANDALAHGFASRGDVQSFYNKIVRDYFDPSTGRFTVGARKLAKQFQSQFRIKTGLTEEVQTADRALRERLGPAYEQRKQSGEISSGIKPVGREAVERPVAELGDVQNIIKKLMTTATRRHANRGAPRPEIVPYVARWREKVVRNAKTGRYLEVEPGSTVWVDGRTGRVYRDPAEALYARGELYTAPQQTQGRMPDVEPVIDDQPTRPAAPETAAAVPEQQPQARAPRITLPTARNVEPNQALVEFLEALPDDFDPADALAQMRAILERQREVANPVAELPPDRMVDWSGDEPLLPIMRKTDGSGEVRLMTPNQRALGKTWRDILGKEQPNNWEVRYIPESMFSHRAGEKRRLFEEAITQDSVPDAQESMRAPQLYSEFAETRIGEAMTDEEWAAFEYAANLKTSNGYTSRQLLAGGRQDVTGKKLRAALYNLDHANNGLDPRRADFNERIDALTKLYELEERLAPNGLVYSGQSRKAAREQIADIFSGYDEPTRKAAYDLINRLNSRQAPNFEATDRQNQFMVHSPGGGERDTMIGMRQDYLPGHTIPALPALYHEVFHWAWFHVLTPRDRIDAARAVQRQLYNETSLDRGELARQSSLSPAPELGIRGGALNAGDSIGEITADMFSQWAMRNRTNPDAQGEAVWQRLVTYVKAVFDKYMVNRQIDPELERLFSKVLPEDQRLRLQYGTAEPQTPTGTAIQKRYREAKMVRSDVEDALRSESPTRIIEAARQLQNYLASISMSRGMANRLAGKGDGARRTTGQFGPLNPIMTLIRQRQSDIHEVLTGRGLPEEYLRGGEGDFTLDPDMVNNAEILRNQEAIAEFFADIYDNGHAPARHGSGGFSPQSYVPDANIETTPLFRLMEEIEGTLEAAFERAESAAIPRVETGNAGRTRNNPNADEAAQKVKRRQRKAKADQSKATEEAIAEVRKEPKKRTRKSSRKDAPAADVSEATSPRSLSMEELIENFETHAGSDRGNDIAFEIMRKAKSEAPKQGKVEVPDAIRKATKPELARMIEDALRAGGPENRATVNQIVFEMQRRGAKSALKPKRSEVISAIRAEVDATEGVSRAEGVPPNANTFTREALTSMTHRDPEVQQTMRTMLFRMLNLMGKATRKALEDVNVMNSEDLVRLGNYDINEVAGSAQFADFTSPEYSHLRSRMRKLAVGLTKGQASPVDVMHEVGHVVARAVMRPEDRARIVEVYRNASDDLKQLVEKEYGRLYKDRGYSTADMEEVLAEEWFAEGLARYLSERATRDQAFNLGDMQNVGLRSRFDALIDQASEFIAYILNGMIGRNDIKQEFRRLTFYGDMFGGYEQPVRNAYARRAGVTPDLAADYASESLRYAPKRKVNKIMDYVRGEGLSEDGKPRVWYHATPNGVRLRKETNPDVVVQMSSAGVNGPGFYMTLNPRVASNTYGERATASALKRMARERDLDDPEVEFLLDELAGLRSTLATKRRERDYVQEGAEGADEISEMINREVLRDLESDILDFAAREQAIMDELAVRGLEPDPYVAPLYVRTENTANFSIGAKYYANDAFVAAFLRKAREFELIDDDVITDVMQAFDPDIPVNGQRAYKMLAQAIDDEQGGTQVGRILTELGYDSLRSTHKNRVVDEDALGQAFDHEVLVVFDPERVKHIDADFFDANDPRLYYRDLEGQPVNPTGPLLRGLYLGRGLEETSPAQIGTELELGEVSSPLIDTVMNIARGKNPTTADIQQVRATSTAMNLMATQSAKMHKIGADWIADWFRPHFPDVQQAFMSQWRPLENMLAKLPDAPKGLSKWAKRSSSVTRGLAARQPRSHTKIVKALRRGDDTHLSTQERNVFRAVREMFDGQYKKMRDAGIYVGHRKNYFPQVWNPDAIRKNQGKFLEDMSEYYVMENAKHGRDVTREQAHEFAQKIYDKLSNDMEDVVHFPVDAQASASPGDSIDFNRLIELDKYPGFVERLEPYLESNLEAIINRYLDASVRRTKITEKFGVNAHGLKDYMLVMQEGAEGIMRLLSTNRVIQKDLWYRDLSGEVEMGQLTDTTQMPFSNRSPQEAREYVELLVQTANEKGVPAARAMLESEGIAPRNQDGSIPHAYQRRVDAILGALNDYKGEPARVASKEYDMLLNSMRAANKRPLADAAFGGMGMVHATRAIRNFNAITLLPFTTLTSFSDLVLPALRSGNMGAWIKGLTHMARDPEYAELIKSTGIAIENQLHEHLTGLHGGGPSRLANAFFNTTLLTPWTEMTRRMAGVTGHESFKAMQRQAFKHYKPGIPSKDQPSEKYRIAHRMLHKHGLEDFLPGKPKQHLSLSDNMLLRDDESVRRAIISFANESTFLPNADDIPLWAQTPIGSTIFQLKSYPLMLGRMAKEVLIDDLRKFVQTGEMQYLKRPALFMSLGPAFGASTLAIKDVVQQRGGEDLREAALRNRNAGTAPFISWFAGYFGFDPELDGDTQDALGWYFEGWGQLGGFGLLLEIMHDIADHADHGAYGKTRIASTIGGPAVGSMFSLIDMGVGAKDAAFGDESNAARRQGMREAVRRVPIIGQTSSAREAIVDATMGEATGRTPRPSSALSDGLGDGLDRGLR